MSAYNDDVVYTNPKSKFKENQIIVTNNKHILIVLSSLKTTVYDSCRECFFNHREYGCAYYTHKYLNLNKDSDCKYASKYGLETLLPNNFCYFKEIEGGV